MCQLLGLSSNKKVNIKLSLREFRHRGAKNPYGWGFGFYNENSQKWEIIKQPDKLSAHDAESEPIFNFKSKLIIGHVRYATCGGASHKNTHPFCRGEWIFAHNGTVKAIKYEKSFKLNKFWPEGDTDSEYAFCYLLEQIDDIEDEQAIFEILTEAANSIKEHGKFNFLLANKEYLYAFGDDKLYFTIRKAPFSPVHLKDEDYEINLGEIKKPDEKAVLIVTEPLTTNEKWWKIVGLKAFKDGKEIKF
jgi:glutamine amidotransferase